MFNSCSTAFYKVAKLEGFPERPGHSRKIVFEQAVDGSTPAANRDDFHFWMLALRCQNGAGFSLLGRGEIHDHEGMGLLMCRTELRNDLCFLDLVSCFFHGQPYNHPQIRIVSDDKNAVCLLRFTHECALPIYERRDTHRPRLSPSSRSSTVAV